MSEGTLKGDRLKFHIRTQDVASGYFVISITDEPTTML